MERIAVSSSMISSVGYDADTQVLEIEFNNTRIYQYLKVPSPIYEGLIQAESPGNYFNTEIRDNYEYQRSQ
jgi:hypothetical protein